MDKVHRRYAAIGGSSPLTARTAEQAGKLESQLGLTVYVGMRNWAPTIADALRRAKMDGVERLVAVCLAPQYSKMSVGLYFRRTQEAKRQLGLTADIVWTKSFHDRPELIEAFAEKLAPALPAEMVLFTAHSLPVKILESGDPYDREARATARLVAEKAGLTAWEFAYQSQGMTSDPWLGPTVKSKLDEFAARGIHSVVLAPIGFVCDHVEILYDIDIEFRDYAAQRGISLRRPESLNDSPTFIKALAEEITIRLEIG